MKQHACTALVVLAATVGAACTTQGNTMLVFGQTQTVGISIGGSVTDQGASFTLGYQDRNFAIVPATVRQADGGSSQVVSTVDASGGEGGEGGKGEDALSVLGQFSVISNSKTADVGLGKFFATGLAAQKLADGFSAQLAADGPDDVASAPKRPRTARKASPPARRASGPGN